jgi:hypothetical protein
VVLVTPSIIDPLNAKSETEVPKTPIAPLDPAEFDKKKPLLPGGKE